MLDQGRRDFIGLLGSAAAGGVVWPLAARAQQGERMRQERPICRAPRRIMFALAHSALFIDQSLMPGKTSLREARW